MNPKPKINWRYDHAGLCEQPEVITELFLMATIGLIGVSGVEGTDEHWEVAHNYVKGLFAKLNVFMIEENVH
jgi:hypothetical protein